MNSTLEKSLDIKNVDHQTRSIYNSIRYVLNNINKSKEYSEEYILVVSEFVNKFMYSTHGIMPINFCFSYINSVLSDLNTLFEEKQSIAILFEKFMSSAYRYMNYREGDFRRPRYYFASILYDMRNRILYDKRLSDEFRYAMLYVMSFDYKKTYLSD